jgi:hypothetical protein
MSRQGNNSAPRRLCYQTGSPCPGKSGGIPATLYLFQVGGGEVGTGGACFVLLVPDHVEHFHLQRLKNLMDNSIIRDLVAQVSIRLLARCNRAV